MTHFFSVLFEYLGQYTVVLFLISLILFLLLIKQIVDNRNSKKQIELLKKERNDIEFKLQIQEKMLFLQSRQASVGELIGNISHQWKEPLGGLGAILSNLHATLLLKGEVSNEKLSDSIDKSYKIIYHLSDTIATFYRFFKAQRSDKIDFNVYEEISNISLMVSYSMKVEQISLNFDCDKNIFLYGDRSEFANVILNIILNAKDILIERKVQKPFIEITVSKKSETVVITIQDNGGGIHQEPIDKIFEYSVSSKEDSTGIGLFIVKNIIEHRMKGNIKVQNNPLGALFTITLPITTSIIDVTSILAYDVEESAYDKIARLEKEVAKQSEVEKALRQWQDIFTQTHWGVAVHKGTNKNFEMVNPAFCKMYGYSTKELKNMTVTDILAPEFLETLPLRQKEAFEKSFVSFETVHIRKDGSRFPVNVDLTVIKNEYDEILYHIANVRDITVQKEIADSLKKSEEAFRAMVENSPDVIMRYDTECRRTYINPIGLLLMGKPEDELLGKTPREFSPLSNLEEFEKAFETVVTEAKEVKIEGEFIIPNGERRWGEQRIVPEFNQHGEVVSVLVIGRDITELRKANQRLLLKKFALDNVQDGVFLIDENSKFHYVNESACHTLGYTKEELLNMGVVDIDPNVPLDIWREHWEDIKKKKTTMIVSEHTRKDKTTFPIEVGSNYFEYQGVGYSLAISRDVTERKKAENEIKEREEKFSKLFMSSPAAVSVTSIDRGVYLEVNDSFLYFTKYTRDEVVGKSSADLQLFANPDERAEFFRRVIEDGMVRGFEFQYRAKDGTTGYGVAYATLLIIQGERCVLAHSYDINDTKQLELVNTAINSTSEAVYITDDTFSIIYVNDGACNMLGYTKEELTSMKVYEVDALYSLENLSELQENKRLSQHMLFETKHKMKNGHIIDVEIAGSSFEFHNKTVYLSVVKDISAKKEYEEQLNLLQTAINNANDAIYIIGDDREIKYVSDTSCRMLGYSVEEFLTMKVEDIDSYMSVEEISGVREQMKEFGSTTFQTKHRAKNGTILDVEITVTKFIFNNTVLNLSIVTDITRQIRQEEEIRELNKTLEAKVAEKTKELEKALQFNESIIHAIPDMLFEVSNDGIYLNIWARDEKLLAQQKEILLGKNFRDMLPPEAVNIVLKTMEEVDRYGSSLGNSYKLDLPDGEHWFELHTTKKEPEGTYLALARDITERKKAQHALIELNATLEEKIEERTRELKKALDFNESIINALPDLLFEIDINGVYLNIWARDEKLLAKQKELLLNKNVKDILSVESAQTVMQAILEAEENGCSFGKVLFINVQECTKQFELSVSKKSDGHFLILSRDISSLR
ncbi:MAG: PAS domain S-box protein [Arcobacteraceae bacterium]|jgi:PAS domain S-box-containing protein|nr:PAS domain S-box protein [Arcobacteraceae bacterium]